MKKNILLFVLFLVPFAVIAQTNKPQTTNKSHSLNGNFYDDYDFDSFSPSDFILDDSDGIYTISTGDAADDTEVVNEQPEAEITRRQQAAVNAQKQSSEELAKEPVVESEPVTAAESESVSEPVVEPVVESQPVAVTEPEPKTVVEPVVESQPVAVTEPEPETAVEPVVESQPIAVTEPEPEPETVVEPVVESQPIAVAEPEPETEVEVAVEPIVEIQPVATYEPQSQPETEPQPVVTRPAAAPAYVSRDDERPTTTQEIYAERVIPSQPQLTYETYSSEEEEQPAVFDGSGHHIQFGFGAGWSKYLTRVSEDMGMSRFRLDLPTFTGNISYFYYPLRWIGVGTGLHVSQYKGDILMNSDAVRLYDKITDANGEYRFIEDADGNRYRHRIGLGDFNEIENIFFFDIPIALQLKYKFSDIAGLYTTLGVKISLPLVSSYKIANGVVNHFGYYGQTETTKQFGSEDFTNRGGGYNMGKQLLPVNFFGYAEFGLAFRLTQKLDLLLGAYFNIAAHDISMATPDADKAVLGFKSADYNYPWMNEYKGLIGTDALGEIRPYNFGVKVTFDYNYATKKSGKSKKDKGEYEEYRPAKRRTTRQPNDTIRDTVVIYRDTIIYRRITTHFTYDSVGYDEEKERRIHEAMDSTSANPYINGTIYRAPEKNSYNPADGYDYVYNKEALDKGRKYSEDLHRRGETLSGDEQEMIDYLSQLSIRFQLDKAYPPFVVPKNGINVLSATLKANPDMVIAVNGHACKLGEERYNQRLALRRARNVAKILKMRGVAEDQMLIASYGSHVPSAYGNHNLAKDRRVEIVLLGSMTYEQREAYLNKFSEQMKIQSMIEEGKRDNAYDLYSEFSNEMIVQEGSSLAKLAKKIYGEVDFWVYLYEANSDIIANPNIIEPGTTLMIPTKEHIINGRSQDAVRREMLQLKEYYLKQVEVNR